MPAARPPIILIHCAANSSVVWTFWRPRLEALGWPTHPLDLGGHGDAPVADLSVVSMSDYAQDVADLVARLGPLPIVMGWSMGGLVALLVAARGLARACVALAPSKPSVRVDASMPLRHGTFGPEEYGILPGDSLDQPTMPDLDPHERHIALSSLGLESRLARDERKRGVVIPSLPCPLLVVTAELDAERPRQQYADLHLPADHIGVKAASHWGLVLNRGAIARTAPAVADWLDKNAVD